MEFITRANYGLPIGNFELDLEDGELRYKISQPLFSIPIPTHAISFILNTALGTLAHYHTGLVQTLYDNIPAKEAIKRLEAKHPEPK